MKPNTEFNIDVEDLDYIEQALRHYIDSIDSEEKNKINQVLGKLHNQKNWYRPKHRIYVSG